MVVKAKLTIERNWNLNEMSHFKFISKLLGELYTAVGNLSISSVPLNVIACEDLVFSVFSSIEENFDPSLPMEEVYLGREHKF